MTNIQSTFSPTIIQLVKEYNSNSKTNQVLNDNPDIASLLKETHGIDRFEFVGKCNQIEKQLIPLINQYHNRWVIVSKNNKLITGIILHPETRQFQERTLPNNVAFRVFENGNVGIALWIDTGYKFSTHLYNVEDIFIPE